MHWSYWLIEQFRNYTLIKPQSLVPGVHTKPQPREIVSPIEAHLLNAAAVHKSSKAHVAAMRVLVLVNIKDIVCADGY